MEVAKFLWHSELTGSALTPANPPSAPASSAAGVDCSGPASGSADRARRARPGDYTTSASRRRRRRWCACQPPARLATPTLFCSPCAIVWRPGRLRASLYSLAPFLLSRCRAEDRVRRPPSCCSWRSTTSREGKYLEQPSRTVVLRAIEIGLRAAVGRFLISREKSGGRSVDFYAVGVWKKRVPGAVQVYSGSSSVDSGGRVVIPHSRACLGV